MPRKTLTQKRRARYGSYLEYLYVENTPEMVWDGERWVEKRDDLPLKPRETALE